MATKVSVKGKAFKMEGVPQLVKTIKTIGDALSGASKGAFDERVRDVTLIPAQMIADEARDMCPVVTGTLRNSIKAQKLQKSVGSFISTSGVRYASWVEYGTSKMSAHPYFRPALNAVRPLAANMLADGLSKVIADMAEAGAWHEKDSA
jgi:HK97 gp10 family phage protein